MLLLLSLSCFLYAPALAQSTLCNDQLQQPRSMYDPSRPRDITHQPEIPADMQRKQAKEMNQERQASLKKDTDKLLQIATGVKQQEDKTNSNQLSLAVLPTNAEVEKLDESSRGKTKTTRCPHRLSPS